MKSRIAPLIFFILASAGILTAREVVNFNTNWKFTKGSPDNAEAAAFDDSAWEDVRIPHDWAISGPFDPKGWADTGKLPWKGEGWYRKHFSVTESQLEGQVFFLFDGVMAFPKVYINGKLAGQWDYGYNSFFVNATEYLREGENVIAVHADTRNHDSRWYPGAGMYRKVSMIMTSNVHVPIWGTYVTTPVVEQNWTRVRAITEVSNHTSDSATIEIETHIVSPTGNVISSHTTTLAMAAAATGTGEQWFTLNNPQLWDIDNPVLFSIKTRILSGGNVTDEYVTPFGVRSFRFTANDGFYLNGRRVQMKGVNLHHDHGPLGAKFYRRAMERQIEIMKSLGVNAVRNSHNVAAPELLDLCDSMGIIVFDEAYDKWDQKADILPGADPFESLERNLVNFVKRDRNHPSVVIWSVGNEMGDVQGNTNGGLRKLAHAVNVVNRYDPTRPVTMASDQKDNARWRHFDYYDVHSWNYGRRYSLAREMEPGKAVIISESASTLSTRGYYHFPLPAQPTDFTLAGHVSSYDLNAPWWAEIPEVDFRYQEEDKYVCGEFVWTGFDYIGEPTPYNNHWAEENNLPADRAAKSSYFGIVDLCGIPKDRYYLYKSYWLPEETTVYLLPHWNWPEREGQNVPVFVYTNGDCAELFVNGKSMGMQCKNPGSKDVTESYRLMWKDITYHPGELKAVAYREGQHIGEAVVRTSGEAASLRLTPDRATIHSGGEDLSYILVEAFDEDGSLCPLADNLLKFEVSGAGSIEGVGNGNPQSLEPFVADTRRLFYGKAMLVVRSNDKPGEITVKVTSENLDPDTVKITVQ